MSIPGLGQLAPVPTGVGASDTKTIILQPYWEFRFSVARTSTITVRLLTGTAERDGNELALNRSYKFFHTKSCIYTLQGCTLEVTGATESRVAEYATPELNPLLTYVNLHFALHDERRKAQAGGRGVQGPRVMICGPRNSGKTSLARKLVGWATRMGSQPLVANLDPDEGVLALPGTVSAAVYGTLMDIEEPACGFGIGSIPSSGPSAVPVKVPIVYYFGREKVEDDVDHWKDLTRKLASSCRAKLNKDQDVRASGSVVDMPDLGGGKEGLDLLAFAVNEFSVNFIIVLGSPQLHDDLQRRLAGEKTPLGEPVYVVGPLDRSDGVATRDGQFMRATRDAAMKGYFFGDAKRTLSPSTQLVSFDDVAIFKAPDEPDSYEGQPVLEAAEISSEMSHWALAVMNASVNDPPETIRQAPVLHFIAIADVDEDRRRLKVLSPTSGRLGNQPMVWGRWPEPNHSLLG